MSVQCFQVSLPVHIKNLLPRSAALPMCPRINQFESQLNNIALSTSVVVLSFTSLDMSCLYNLICLGAEISKSRRNHTRCDQNVTNDRFLRNFSWQFFFTLRVFATNLLRGSCRRNIFIFSFWCVTWDTYPSFTSNKPSHYLLGCFVAMMNL